MDSSSHKLPVNPRDEANIFSILLFYWTIPIFKNGYKKVLEICDLFQPLKIDRSAALGDRLEKKWKQQLETKNPSIIKAIFATFWKEFCFLGSLTFFNELCIRLIQPVVLGKLLDHFRLDLDKEQEKSNLALLSIAMVSLSCMSALSVNHFTMKAFHIGMKCRVAVCSLIYRKSLNLSQSILGDTAPGKIVNLLSNDVSRFDIVTIFLNSMWSAPILSAIVGVILWREIRWAGLVGIVVIFIVVPIQSYTGKLSSKFRYQTAVRTDERVRLMDEIISGVQVIKMYAWEQPFSALIRLGRRMELKIVKKNSYVRALYMTFSLFTTRAAMFCTMMTIVLTNGEITATKVFVIASYFNVIAWTMSQMFVRGVAEIAEALVSFKRIQKYLEHKEKLTVLNKEISVEEKLDCEFDNELTGKYAVKLLNATANWNINSSIQHNEEDSTLNNINLDLKKGQLIGIVGSVGAGKSSLLQVILEELPLSSGKLFINGRISYATQEPWIFPASVRQNILFGKKMEKNRYDKIVKCCALHKDFDSFQNGDKTVIGEKGSSLSGGQKARISLARAIYKDADIYLFDDPLSAVDAHVGKHLFDEIIGPNGRLARKMCTRLLATHQIHFLKEADWVVILNNGQIEVQGKPNELSKSGDNFTKLLEQNAQYLKNQNERTLKKTESFQSSTRSLVSYRSSKSIESNITDLNDLEKNIETKSIDLELSSKGIVKGSLIGTYLKCGANFYIVFLIFALFTITQIIVSCTDYWISFWTNQEELKKFYSNESFAFVNDDMVDIKKDIFDDIDAQVISTERTFEAFNNSLLSTELCLYIHGVLVISIFVVGILRAVGLYRITLRASQRLHDDMFRGIISATIRFFDTNPSGRILNRFSKDMGAVDELLPKVFLDASQIILAMFGSIIVSILVEPYFLIPVFILGCLFWKVRKIYLKTSKNIKRLEGTTRSPVFTHLAATLSGLSTIRAFGSQKELIEEFDNHQDLHTGVWYMFISTATAFGLSLDVVCLTYMTCVTFYFVFIDNNVSGSIVGLVITQSMSLTGLLQWGIRQSAEVANQLMSVERIMEYCQLQPEKQPKNSVQLPKDWPHDGKVEFINVFYRHFEEAEPVLKNINMLIQPQEKIGIVGRTGAGKSSLIGALFRLAIVEGDVLIDDIKTSLLTLNDLRSKLSIIPQDPVLFSGTLRRNLDPFEEYLDNEIWKALEAVELKDIASGNLGLQTMVTTGGSNFSIGQRQLICLARALLRKNKILILDEATANVDPHTDSLIQDTIRNRFSSCTVMTIAHRLNTIMDSDRVIVMNFGAIEEFDTPYNLLQCTGGIFKNMVESHEKVERETLYTLAEQKHLSKIKVA